MTYRDTAFLLGQVACILLNIFWIGKIVVRFYDMRYSWRVIIQQAIRGNLKPYRWVQREQLYRDYLGLLIGLIFLNFALINQLRDKTVYLKPWEFFVGALMIAYFSIKMLKYTKANT